MKKYIALLLAVLLLIGLTACGNDTKPNKETPSTTVTTKPTVAAPTGSAVAPSGTTTAPTDTTTPTEGSGTVQTTVSATRPTDGTSGTTSTTIPLPTGATVPIGTKPTTTVTTTPATGTTPAPSVSGSTTATTTPTTTTPTTAKPTEPPVQGPYIVLPAVGSDIDLVKQKNRIRISNVAAWFNEDGTIGVQLTVMNYSSNWITEETDYIEYTCYDKEGNVLQKNVRISLGCIDTKKNKEKSYTFDVPANTAEVKLTRSKITYWTEWA